MIIYELEEIMNYESEEKNRQIRSNVIEWIKSIGIAIVTTMLVTTFIFNTAVVQ